MYTAPILFFLLAAASAIPINPMFCNCGLGHGEDVCTDKKITGPLVVRPLEVPKPILPGVSSQLVCKEFVKEVKGEPPLRPLGGPCSYQATIVKPAILPKPQCFACAGKFNIANSQIFNQGLIGEEVIYTGPNSRPIVVDEVAPTYANPASLAPADAVSLAAAYKALYDSSCDSHFVEDKLSFGFRRLPKDLPLVVKKTANVINEEDLYNLNGQIVELKKFAPCSTTNLDDEAAEGLLELIEEEAETKLANEHLKKITLGELGYAPAQIKPVQFVNVQVANPKDQQLEVAIQEKPCLGFQPGHVLREQVPLNERPVLSAPVPLPSFLVDGDDSSDFVMSAPGSCGCGHSYSVVSTSSSASKKNSCQQSVLLQKLLA